ncbi:MAG: hypothetical protein Q9163_004230 [Psora crenata]
MDKVVLVKGWRKGANWSFPRGKIDKDELDLACALREVYEETGYDLKQAGLVGEENDMKYINVAIRGQEIRLYVFRGVPVSTQFEPRTRKEISKISWHKLSDLPTAKSRRQLQEGYGEELAVNANKFYMVAPFLGPLKKWIAQQRKRDKAIHDSQPKAITPSKENHVKDTALEQDSPYQKVHEEIAEQYPLASFYPKLQQPNQAQPSDLPEVLGHGTRQQASEPKELPASADLMALLLNGNGATLEQKPWDPSDQVIEEPSMPQSARHHSASQIVAKGPPPPSSAFPEAHGDFIAPTVQPSSGAFASLSGTVPPMPQVHAMSASSKLAQLPPSSASVYPSAPYQRSSDQSLQNLYPPQQPSAPPASKLPRPKLTAHASGLLSLFKGGSLPMKPSAASGTIQKATASLLVQHKETVSKSPFSFMPPQVSRTSSDKASQGSKTPSGHQTNLLKLFHTSSVPHAGSAGLPHSKAAIELSASSPPGQRSKVANASVKARPHGMGPSTGSAMIRKGQHPSIAPVSATLDGPLDVPQLDMVRSTSRKSEGLMQKRAHIPVADPRIQILSRPPSFRGPRVAPLEKPYTQPPPQPPSQKHQPAVLTTSTKQAQPLTPDLKARTAPSKPFQPQILRRFGPPPDAEEPSPIQPLPSPQQNVPIYQHLVQRTEQKISLLSLFTKSPPGTAPSSVKAFHAEDPASLISPLENLTTPLTQQEASDLEDVTLPAPTDPNLKSIGVTRKVPLEQIKTSTTSGQMPPATQTDDTSWTAASGENHSEWSGKHKPTPTHPSTTTPVQKQFLLSYLADVVRGGR